MTTEDDRGPLMALIDRLVPERLGLSPSALLTARVLAGAVLVAVVVSIATGATFWLSGLTITGAITFGYGALIGLSVWVLRRTSDVRMAMQVALVLTAIYFAGATLAQTPIDVSQVFWLAVLPLAAMLGLGRRAGLLWGVLAVLEAALLVGAVMFGWRGGQRPLHPFAPALARLFTFVPAVALLSYVFDSARQRAFDAMERARAEAEAARREAERASAAKSQFLANVSHELRTPMNAVLGLTGALLRDPRPPAEEEQLRLVEESGRAMVALVSDLLDVAKIEAGQLALEPAPFDLRKLLTSVAALFRPSAEVKGLTLACTLAPDLPAWVLGDALRLRQVLANLLGNAVKFTVPKPGSPAGRVELRAARLPDGRLEIQVIDTGIGIAEEAQSKLFQKFVQVDETHTRRFGGTGLGLAIARDLVELMGGRIHVDSALGRGTTMRVVVPLAEAQAVERREGDKVLLAVENDGRPVLVVDDSLVNQRVAEILLRRLGFGVEVAANGREAIERWSPGRYRAILMDVQMPELDGYAAARAIRAREVGAEHTLIIGLTASAVAGEREKGLAAGMDDYLTKPVTLEALAGALSAASG